MTRVVAPVAILGSLTVCTESSTDEPEGPAFSVRDSAGVRISESSSPRWSPGTGWRIAAEPTVTVESGGANTDPPLYRVADAIRVAPDTIVVANRGTSELRWYAGNGALVRTVGRPGSGPGEFGEPLGPGPVCRSPEGHLIVGDFIQRRVQVFSRSGDFLRLHQLSVNASLPAVQGCFADGTLLASLTSEELVPTTGGNTIQTQWVWSRLSEDGERINEIVSLAAPPRYEVAHPSGRSTRHSIPFTVRPSAASGPGQVFATRGAEPEIERYRLDGTLDMVIRWEPITRVVGASVYDRYRAYMVDAQAPERREYWQRFFDLDLDVPEQLPAVDDLTMDETGHLWAKRYRLPWAAEAPVWDVFDPDGRWLGGVEMPEGLEPLQIGRDFVLGLTRDDLGTERVAIYALFRGVPQGP